jgi:hypothetical protein
MSMISIKYLLIIIICLSCSNKQIQQKYKLKVDFQLDDSIITNDNNFKILFIYKTDTSSATIKTENVSLPLLKDSIYEVSFQYKNFKLSFKGIHKETVSIDQNMEWKFGIRNRPFNITEGLLSTKDFESDTTTRQLIYWQFNPQEHGDGIQIVQKVK